MTEEETRLKCCKIGCNKDAEYEIWDGTPEYTHSCLEHIPDMMTDAEVHEIYKV